MTRATPTLCSTRCKNAPPDCASAHARKQKAAPDATHTDPSSPLPAELADAERCIARIGSAMGQALTHKDASPTATRAADAPVPLAASAPARHHQAPLSSVCPSMTQPLWAPPGFVADRYATMPFALELRYLRNLSGAAIAQRSLDEMRRGGELAQATETQWLSDMRAGFSRCATG